MAPEHPPREAHTGPPAGAARGQQGRSERSADAQAASRRGGRRSEARSERDVLERLPEPGRRLVKFARELVATPSPTGSEHDAARLLARRLEQLGYRDVEVDRDGNVVGYLGDGPPRLMFNGHIDHVPPADMEDPYAASLEPGTRWDEAGWGLRGRGSCDMKANVAAGAFAAAFLPRDARLEGSYVFTADVQEEIDSPVGVQALIERGVRAPLGLSGESTGLDVALGHRGKLRFDVTVHGRASHASTPSDGVNAVFVARPFLEALERAGADLPSHPAVGEATLTVTGIRSEPAGEAAVVPYACVLRVDRRYVPGESPESCLDELRSLVAEVAAATGTRAEVRLADVYPLMSTPADHPLVDAGRAAVRAVTRREPALRSWRFGVNATFMNEAGIPTIGIGPGDERWAHTDEEHVPIGELVSAARIYAELIRALCGTRATAPESARVPRHA